MKTSVLFATAAVVAAIACVPEPASGLCVNENGNLIIERDAPPSNDAFVSSGPARSASQIEFKLDLSDLDELTVEEDSAEIAFRRVPLRAEPLESSDLGDGTNVEITAPRVGDLQVGQLSNTSALEILEVEESSVASQEALLNAVANRINTCP